MSDKLVTLEWRANGDLAVTLTDAGRRESEEARLWGEPDDIALYLLLEYDLCNGWGLFTADQLGALSQAPVLAEGWDVDHNGLPQVHDDHWWYFEPYQVRSVMDALLRDGVAIFTKGA